MVVCRTEPSPLLRTAMCEQLHFLASQESSLLFQEPETCAHGKLVLDGVSVCGELNPCSRNRQDIAKEEELIPVPFLQPAPGMAMLM